MCRKKRGRSRDTGEMLGSHNSHTQGRHKAGPESSIDYRYYRTSLRYTIVARSLKSGYRAFCFHSFCIDIAIILHIHAT